MSLPSDVARTGPPGRDLPGREGPAGLEAIVGAEDFAEGFAAPGAGARRRVAISSYLTGWLAGHWSEATDGAEPSGAATTAAVLSGAFDAVVNVKGPVVALVSGGNMAADRLAELAQAK